MIREREFSNLFANNPVTKQQKMSKYFDEQDFNSDSETIERNKVDLLKQLSQGITRFQKGDPTKFVENLQASATEIKAEALEKHVAQVNLVNGGRFSGLTQPQLTSTSPVKIPELTI